MIAGVSDQGAHRRLRLFAGWAGGLGGLPQMFGYGLGPRLNDSVHNGLSVRPAGLGAGGVTGAAASVGLAPEFVSSVQTGRRIPMFKGLKVTGFKVMLRFNQNTTC